MSIDSGDKDIEGFNTLDVTGLNYITIDDSNPVTSDTLQTLTGGQKGQHLIIELKESILFEADNNGTADTIQWGRGTSSGSTLPGAATEIFEFLYNGTAWHLLARYNL